LFQNSRNRDEERRAAVNTRSFYQPSTIQTRKECKSIDVAKDICTRSFVGTSNIKARDMSVQPKQNSNYQLQRSGKKLNEEIDRLQLKIKQFEEEKKKMNINFKPFNYSNSKSVVALPTVSNQTQKYEKNELSDRKPS
jgi:septal ring factor EnvC (AmiA/AmiB activator)